MRPHYLPVEDSIELHIDFFALSPLTFLRKFMQIFQSKFIILTILHLLLAVVKPPVNLPNTIAKPIL
jgi:hypothetical protein